MEPAFPHPGRPEWPSLWRCSLCHRVGLILDQGHGGFSRLSGLPVTLEGVGRSALPFLSFVDCLPGSAPALPTLPASSLPHSPPSPSNGARLPASCSLRSRDASPAPGLTWSRVCLPTTRLLWGPLLVGRRLEREAQKRLLFGLAGSSVAQTFHPSGPSASLTNCLIFLELLGGKI